MGPGKSDLTGRWRTTGQRNPVRTGTSCKRWLLQRQIWNGSLGILSQRYECYTRQQKPYNTRSPERPMRIPQRTIGSIWDRTDPPQTSVIPRLHGRTHKNCLRWRKHATPVLQTLGQQPTSQTLRPYPSDKDSNSENTIGVVLGTCPGTPRRSTQNTHRY